MLFDGDPRLGSGGLSLPLGKWRKIRVLPRCAGGRSQIVPTIQSHPANNKEHLRTHNGRSKHHGSGCARRDGQKSARVRPYLGRIRINLCS